MTLIRLIAVALGFGFAFGAMGANTATPAWKRGIEHQRQADLGDGTFLNPVLAGDRPDPSVLKDGDDYYLTLSSFTAYPGLPVWHSRDLINWQPIGHAITKNVGSIWSNTRAATTSTSPHASEAPSRHDAATSSCGRTTSADRGASPSTSACRAISTLVMQWAKTASATCSSARGITCS